MGDEAVTKLLSELQEGATHQHSTTIFDPQLIVRESTATSI
jgi:DNA-binding LacI/PurR family transcriptional regulator